MSVAMIAMAEASGYPFRIAMIGFAFATRPVGQPLAVVLSLIIAVDLLLYRQASHQRGPLTWGRAGVTFEVLHNVVVVLLSSLVAPRGTYSYGGGIPLGNYPAASIALLVNYPTRRHFSDRQRSLIAFAVVTALNGLFVVGALLNGTDVDRKLLVAVVPSWVGNVAAIFLGIAVWRFCSEVARREVEAQTLAYKHIFDFLHSHVKSGLSAVGLSLEAAGVTGSPLNKVRELKREIAKQRVALLLEQARPPVATLLSERMRIYDELVQFVAVPEVGAVSLPPTAMRLLDRALGDLLSNAVNAGVGKVKLDLTVKDGLVSLVVFDDGPGFPNELLDRQGGSLHELRSDLRALGGDLRKSSAIGWSTIVTAKIPSGE